MPREFLMGPSVGYRSPLGFYLGDTVEFDGMLGQIIRIFGPADPFVVVQLDGGLLCEVEDMELTRR